MLQSMEEGWKTHVVSLCFKCFFIDMLQVFHVAVAKIWDVTSVSDVCCKHFFKMFHLFFIRMFASVFYLDIAYVSHMLQEYVPMILAVSVLCRSKCFYVASCKCSI
jgi:hypothetical protein